MGAGVSSTISQKFPSRRKNNSWVFLVALIKQMSDLEEVSNSVMRRRAACEAWKITHRDYYLEQKRRLATRPEYKAHRRDMYKQRSDELKLLGILPRKRGRPMMYVGPEALEMKRQRAKEAAARYRLKQISQQQEKDESTTSTSSSEESD
jgi:hypothetical protein